MFNKIKEYYKVYKLYLQSVDVIISRQNNKILDNIDLNIISNYIRKKKINNMSNYNDKYITKRLNDIYQKYGDTNRIKIRDEEKTDEQKLDEIDIKTIELYVRKKKLGNINNK